MKSDPVAVRSQVHSEAHGAAEDSDTLPGQQEMGQPQKEVQGQYLPADDWQI